MCLHVFFCARQWLLMVEFGACAYTSFLCQTVALHGEIWCMCLHVFNAHTLSVHVFSLLTHLCCMCSHVSTMLTQRRCMCSHYWHIFGACDLNACTQSTHVLTRLWCSHIVNACILHTWTQSMHVLAHLKRSHIVNACILHTWTQSMHMLTHP